MTKKDQYSDKRLAYDSLAECYAAFRRWRDLRPDSANTDKAFLDWVDMVLEEGDEE